MIIEILKRVSENKSINLSNFPNNFDNAKMDLEWMVNDLLTKGYLKKNELSCHFSCVDSNSDNSIKEEDYSDLKFYLELTEEGWKLIS